MTTEAKWPGIVVPENERAARAVIRLLKMAASLDASARLSVEDIVVMTQATPDDVRVTLDLVDRAELLDSSFPLHSDHGTDPANRTTYTMYGQHLDTVFDGSGWANDNNGSRLSLAFAGNGEYCLKGWRGQDAGITRNGYVETRDIGTEDWQETRITEKGVAVYHILRLAYPPKDEIGVAA